MRILDLDLDFFINDIRHEIFHIEGRYDECTPLTEQQVRDFLEKQCGLSRCSKIKGRFVEQHHEAFYFWRELVEQGKLHIPFDLVHVDAHSDMAFADNRCLKYIMGDLLHKHIEERSYPDESILGCANYVVFAAACRWLNSVTFVTHPKWHNDDLSRFFFKDLDISSKAIQLRKYNDVENIDLGQTHLPEPTEVEPEVSFKAVPGNLYLNDSNFSYVVLCHSPEYTPTNADLLITIILEYIDPI